MLRSEITVPIADTPSLGSLVEQPPGSRPNVLKIRGKLLKNGHGEGCTGARLQLQEVLPGVPDERRRTKASRLGRAHS